MTVQLLDSLPILGVFGAFAIITMVCSRRPSQLWVEVFSAGTEPRVPPNAARMRVTKAGAA